MFDDRLGFLTRAFLQREWALDYKAWSGSDEEAQLLKRLRTWAARRDLKERSSEGAFVQTFFVDTWGYQLAGRSADAEFTAWPGFPVPTTGAGGGTGEADLALGWFGDSPNAVPQVLCEFKDIRSDLDAPRPARATPAPRSSSASTIWPALAAACSARSQCSPGGGWSAT